MFALHILQTLIFPLDGTVAVLASILLFCAATYPYIMCNFPHGWFIFCRQRDIFVYGMWRNAVVWPQMGGEQRENTDVSSAPALLFWGSLVSRFFLVFNLFCLDLLSWQPHPPPTCFRLCVWKQTEGCGTQMFYFIAVFLQLNHLDRKSCAVQDYCNMFNPACHQTWLSHVFSTLTRNCLLMMPGF